MDTFTLTFSIIVGLLCMVAIALTIWLVSRHRKLEKAWKPIEKEINRTRFTMARAIVLQHSDPEWRKEWLQKIDLAESEL